MSTNNDYLKKVSSTILEQKLTVIRNELSSAYSQGTIETKAALMSELARLVKVYLDEDSTAFFSPKKVRANTLPDPAKFNEILKAITDDLTVLFAESEVLEGLIINSFNTVVLKLGQLDYRLQAVYSKLADYILFASDRSSDVLYFKESFSSMTGMNPTSSALKGNFCDINLQEGIATLDIREGDTPLATPNSVRINAASNGVAGNNQEIGAQRRDDLQAITDNDPSTWYEYEKVVKSIAINDAPLILDMSLIYDSPKIINRVYLDPINFGTIKYPEIVSIDTSLDGSTWSSIKDDLSVADFLADDPENIFLLSPAASRYRGTGCWTFTPRKVKFVRIVIKQRYPHLISTPIGKQYRYAIGLRTINVYGYKFESSSQLISKRIDFGAPIDKVVLTSAQTPIAESSLAGIDHFVSPDDGQTWYQISPKDFESSDQSTPRLLNFNNSESNSINTSQDVTSLTYKAELYRNSDAFSKGGKNEVEKPISEVFAIPTRNPYTIDLSEKPVQDSVTIIDPVFGGRGKDEVFFQTSVIRSTAPNISFVLPWADVSHGGILPALDKISGWRKYEDSGATMSGVYQVDRTQQESLYVDGRKWDKVNNLTVSGIGSTSKVYSLNYRTGAVTFGDSTNGEKPASGATATLKLKEERLAPSSFVPHKSVLDFASDGVQENVNLYRYDENVIVSNIVLKAGEREHKIYSDGRIVYDEEITLSGILSSVDPGGYLASELVFKDGYVEFIEALYGSITPGQEYNLDSETEGYYSVDYEHGTLYTSAPIAGSQKTMVTFEATPVYKLLDTEWYFYNNLSNTIIVNDAAYTTKDELAYSIPIILSGEHRLVLPDFSIAHGVTFNETVSGAQVDSEYRTFRKEVPYIDGDTEFKGALVTSTQDILGVTEYTDTNIAYFSLLNPLYSVTDAPPYFSDTSFFNNRESSLGAVSALGDWYYESTSQRIYFYKGVLSVSSLNAGQIGYQYTDPTSDDWGLYSIDYKKGVIYTRNGLFGPDPYTQNTWSYSDLPDAIEVTYQYTDYRIQYNIAAQLDASQYEVNYDKQLVTLKDKDIIDRLTKSNTSLDRYVKIAYRYVVSISEYLKELENYFTPVLSDIAIRVSPKRRF